MNNLTRFIVYCSEFLRSIVCLSSLVLVISQMWKFED